MTPRLPQSRATKRPPHPADHRGLNWGLLRGLAFCALFWATVLLLWWASRGQAS